jgi:hypothetical protein
MGDPALNDQEGRIRATLGIRRGPLPEVRTEWLRKYYEFLLGRLSLPFEAYYAGELGPFRQSASLVTAIALLDPGTNSHHERWGLACRVHRGSQEGEIALVDLEVEADHANYQLMEDYWYWFWNWRFDARI